MAPYSFSVSWTPLIPIWLNESLIKMLELRVYTQGYFGFGFFFAFLFSHFKTSPHLLAEESAAALLASEAVEETFHRHGCQ